MYGMLLIFKEYQNTEQTHRILWDGKNGNHKRTSETDGKDRDGNGIEWNGMEWNGMEWNGIE